MVRIFIFSLFCIFCLPATTMAQDWGKIGYATCRTYIRAEPSAKAEIIGRMDKGDWLKVDFHQNNWYAVFSPFETYRNEAGALGYVYSTSLRIVTPKQTPKAYPAKQMPSKKLESLRWGTVIMVPSIINVRTSRSTQAGIAQKLYPGQKVKIDFKKDDWVAVFPVDETDRTEKKALGYVYAPLLKETLYSSR